MTSNIPYDHNLRLASFDISNTYTNIPTHELLSIIDTACDKNLVEERLKRDIFNLVKDHNRPELLPVWRLDIQAKWRPCHGCPNLLHFLRNYLQHQENSKIYDLLRNHNVVRNFRYVDDILIIYNEITTDIEDLFHCFNSLNPNLKFTLEKGARRRIHFLDLTIHREHNKFSIDIYLHGRHHPERPMPPRRTKTSCDTLLVQ